MTAPGAGAAGEWEKGGTRAGVGTWQGREGGEEGRGGEGREVCEVG